MADEIVNKIGLHELIEKTKLSDEDIIILEDEENTKKISFRNLRDSLIDDEELPSTHRMYSSHKLDTAIKNFQKQLDYDIGKVEGKVENIEKDYMKSEDVDNKIKEFSKEVSSIAEIDTIKKALESKRNISDPITCDDLETGENEKKIQLKNLSFEVISSMVGTTPVTVPAVLKMIVFLITASLFMIAIMNIAAATCFWIINSGYVMVMAVKFKDYARYPATIFNPVFKFIFTFIIPIAFIAYYPSLVVLRPDEIPILSWLSPVIGIVFFFISYKIWMKGAMSYSGTGS